MTRNLLIIFFISSVFLTAYKYIYSYNTVKENSIQVENRIPIKETDLYEDLIILNNERIRDINKDHFVISDKKKIFTDIYESLLPLDIKKWESYNLVVKKEEDFYYLAYIQKVFKKEGTRFFLSPLINNIYLEGLRLNNWKAVYVSLSASIWDFTTLEEKVEFLNNYKRDKSNYIITGVEWEYNESYIIDLIYIEEKNILLENKINSYNFEIKETIKRKEDVLKQLDSLFIKKEEGSIKLLFIKNGLTYSENQSSFRNRERMEEHFKIQIDKIYQKYASNVYIEVSKFEGL